MKLLHWLAAIAFEIAGVVLMEPVLSRVPAAKATAVEGFLK
jgi:hypothetical protein